MDGWMGGSARVLVSYGKWGWVGFCRRCVCVCVRVWGRESIGLWEPLK